MTKDERIYMMGLSSSIHSLEDTIAVMQAELDDRRNRLATLQLRDEPELLEQRGAPPRITLEAIEPARPASKRKGFAQNNYWDAMSPEERSIEIKRRKALSASKTRKKPHHQVTAAGRAAISAAQKKRWAATKRKPTVKMAPTVRQARIDLDKLHPRDARSPKHAEWLEMMRKAQVKHWAGMSKAEKKAQVAAMQASRQPRVNGAATV
jgi:hypothetical protein